MAERSESLRGLAGAGRSKVGTGKAMRARDVSRAARPPRPGEPRRDGPVERDGQSGGGTGSSGSSPDAS
jgi:hypothetical protein